MDNLENTPTLPVDFIDKIITQCARDEIHFKAKIPLREFFFKYTSKALLRADVENKHYNRFEYFRDEICEIVIDAALIAIADINFIPTHHPRDLYYINQQLWWAALSVNEKTEYCRRLIPIHKTAFIDLNNYTKGNGSIPVNYICPDNCCHDNWYLHKNKFTIYDLMNLAGKMLIENDFQLKITATQLAKRMMSQTDARTRSYTQKVVKEISAITPLRILKVLNAHQKELIESHGKIITCNVSKYRFVADAVCFNILKQLPKFVLIEFANDSSRDRVSRFTHILGIVKKHPFKISFGKFDVIDLLPKTQKNAIDNFLEILDTKTVYGAGKTAIASILSDVQPDFNKFPTNELKDYLRMGKDKFPPADHKVMLDATNVFYSHLLNLDKINSFPQRTLLFELYSLLVSKGVTKPRIRRLIKSTFNYQWFTQGGAAEHDAKVAIKHLVSFVKKWPTNKGYSPLLNHVIENLSSRLGGANGDWVQAFANWSQLGNIAEAAKHLMNERRSIPALIALSRNVPKHLVEIRSMLKGKTPLRYNHNDVDLALDFVCQTNGSKKALDYFKYRQNHAPKEYALAADINHNLEFEHSDFLISIESHDSLYGTFGVGVQGVCIGFNSSEHKEHNNTAVAHLVVLDKKSNAIVLWGLIVRDQLEVDKPRYILNNLQGKLPTRWKMNFPIIRDKIRELLSELGEVFIFNQRFNSVELVESGVDERANVTLISPMIRLDLGYQALEGTNGFSKSENARFNELESNDSGLKYSIGKYATLKLGVTKRQAKVI